MKRIALLLAVLVALSAQAPPAPTVVRHLVYQFGFNTKAASSGNGTGTTTIDISAAPDGGMMITGTDSWWNTVRPRAQNTCELYPNGNVACLQAPYAISPMQLTIFPLLATHFFDGLAAGASNTWKHSYTVKAAVVPGASGYAGQLNTWNVEYTLHGKGPIPDAHPFVLIATTGTLNQQGGRYLKASSKQTIAYDPAAKVVSAVSDTRTHLPMKSVYSNDLVQLKLLKDSAGKH